MSISFLANFDATAVIFLYIITPAAVVTSITLDNPVSTSTLDAGQTLGNGLVNASDVADFNTTTIASYTIEDSNLSEYMRWYHIFGCLWGWGFLSYVL